MKLYKKHSLVYLLLMLLTISCSNELDLFPEESINPSQLNSSDLPQLINGVYNRSTIGIGNRFVDFDLLANHFEATPLFAGDDVNYVRNRLSPTETESWWLELYEAIFNANVALEVIDNLEGDFNNEKATALYLRGLAYYYLVTRFGGVPLLPQNTTEIVQRSTAAETWSFITTDLTNAESLADNFTNESFVSKEAIQALLARVYISTGNNSGAENMAEAVIASTSGNFSLESNFASIFSKNGNNEVIFSLGNDPVELVRQYVTFNPNDHPVSGSQQFAPTDDIFNNLYTNADLRKDATLIVFNSQNIINKYTESRNLPVIVSRLAEMYLISAEAQGYPSGLTRLNELRNVRGLGDSSATNQDSFIDAILDERQKEFYAEGFYWYDLVRTDKAIERLDNVTEQNQLLLPIPQREIDLTGISQNPGY
ncbi:RagB/SusD family nutrient uptake outer membrane protein [Flavivirga spongiicola]|uniref:RagB/SusD family nutrient uptake outer membrane protein n=1 Tax=Flavivirga spongiicola TaxID=421621 RepID=A0ABU7XP84_9FLAO|nr:RagB/SusD family nutrient uptake outer membrane protein [Flavivirga sp. MEBiC05379]MDO5981393.1 RagB/SusD family nutrient uptake outer membrane protein [Flavivirga sp. MEBiC05379]